MEHSYIYHMVFSREKIYVMITIYVVNYTVVMKIRPNPVLNSNFNLESKSVFKIPIQVLELYIIT